MRFLARVLISLGAIAIIIGFFLPFYKDVTPAITFWDGTSGLEAWKFWLIGGASILALILMLVPSKVVGLTHIILGGGSVYLIYTIIGSPELQSLFGNLTVFQIFLGNLAYGGYAIIGGALAVFLGGVFELAS
ncbi:MAG: hypothetical protein WCN99_06705 [bacterium]